jgi:hypothetical protein
MDLLAIVVVTLLIELLIYSVPLEPVRVALGVLFVLFFPGYVLVSALYPWREQLQGVERIALGLGLSLALVPLLGLALNFTPWGIRRQLSDTGQPRSGSTWSISRLQPRGAVRARRGGLAGFLTSPLPCPELRPARLNMLSHTLTQVYQGVSCISNSRQHRSLFLISLQRKPY